jgi:hypothetical protein
VVSATGHDLLPRLTPVRFDLSTLLRWTGLVVPLAAAIAAVSAHVQQLGFAPLGLFSILVGLLLGAGMAFAALVTNMGHRPSGLAAAVFLALLTALAQHGFAYCRYVAAYRATEQTEARLLLLRQTDSDFGPAGLSRFLRAGARQGAVWLWLLDATLIVVTSLVVVFVQLRRPYCNACRDWYRVIQSGPLEVDVATRLAAATGIELPAIARSVGYRLLACRSGCHPIGLRLSWIAARGPASSPRVWLDGDRRDQAITLVDPFRQS